MWIGMRSVWLRSVMYSTHTQSTQNATGFRVLYSFNGQFFYDFLLRFRCLSFVRPVILPTNYKCRVLWNRFCKCDPNRRKKNNWATKNAIIVRFESSLWTELVLDESFCLQPISWALRSLSRFYCIASISWIKCMRWFTIKTNRMWNILH